MGAEAAGGRRRRAARAPRRAPMASRPSPHLRRDRGGDADGAHHDHAGTRWARAGRGRRAERVCGAARAHRPTLAAWLAKPTRRPRVPRRRRAWARPNVVRRSTVRAGWSGWRVGRCGELAAATAARARRLRCRRAQARTLPPSPRAPALSHVAPRPAPPLSHTPAMAANLTDEQVAEFKARAQSPRPRPRPAPAPPPRPLSHTPTHPHPTPHARAGGVRPVRQGRRRHDHDQGAGHRHAVPGAESHGGGAAGAEVRGVEGRGGLRRAMARDAALARGRRAHAPTPPPPHPSAGDGGRSGRRRVGHGRLSRVSVAHGAQGQGRRLRGGAARGV